MCKNTKAILGLDRFNNVKSIIGERDMSSHPAVALNKIQNHLDHIKTVNLNAFSTEGLEFLESRIIVLLDAKNCLKEYLDQCDPRRTATILRIKDLLK